LTKLLNSNPKSIYTLKDVKTPISQCNFNYAIGPNSFDANLLLNCQTISEKYTEEIIEALNSYHLPSYLAMED